MSKSELGGVEAHVGAAYSPEDNSAATEGRLINEAVCALLMSCLASPLRVAEAAATVS